MAEDVISRGDHDSVWSGLGVNPLATGGSSLEPNRTVNYGSVWFGSTITVAAADGEREREQT